MKNRLSFAIVVLVAAMLACKVPLIDDQPEGASFTEILSMAVEPRAGPIDSSGTSSFIFTLEVTYRAYREDHPVIYCNYVRPDGAIIPIGTIFPPLDPPFFTKDNSFTQLMELPFRVIQKDGAPKLGTYTAGCGDGYGNTLTTTFIVVEEVGLDEMGRDFSKVLNMAVTPPAGSGNFTLEVTYRWNDSIADTGSPPDIYCNYVSPDGATKPVGIIYPTYVEVITTKIEKLEFSVTQEDGKTKPGTYLASCTPKGEEDEDRTTVTTTFTVTDTEATVSVTPTAESLQPPEQVAFTINGAFNLTWPDTAGHPGEYTSGEIQINVDPKTGLATGSLRGSGSGTMEVRHGDHFHTVQWNYSYTALSLTGSIDPLTGILTLNGTADAKYNWAGDTCDTDQWGVQTCMSTSPEGQFPVKITGTVNLVTHTGSGKVDATQNPDYPYLGEWQAGP